MGSIGGPEVLVILLVALIVLGPSRLPDAARQAGKALGELRRMSSGFQAEMRDAMRDATATPSSVAPPPPPSADVAATEAPFVNPWASSFPEAYGPDGRPIEDDDEPTTTSPTTPTPTPPPDGPSFS